MKTIRNLRWWIAGHLAAATALNYLDRQNRLAQDTRMKYLVITAIHHHGFAMYRYDQTRRRSSGSGPAHRLYKTTSS